MASTLPNIPGTGNRIPISNYIAGMTDAYPNTNRRRVVETSINSRERVDFMPINAGLNQGLSDKYIEFRIKGSEGVFLDLSSLCLEMKLRFTRRDGAPLQNVDRDAFTIVNGISNTFFKSVNVFFNDRLVESSPYYNYTTYIKMLKSISPTTLSTLGVCGKIRDDYRDGGGIRNDYDLDNIKHLDWADLRDNGVETFFPLLLDITNVDMYLLDNVDITIRLEIANQNWYMGYVGDEGISTHVDKATLWVDKVLPHFNAMTALTEALNKGPVEYVFNKSLVKTYVIGARESSIVADNPFNNVIPEKLTMCFIRNSAFSGEYERNPLHFSSMNMTDLRITINGNTIYNVRPSTRLYYEVLRSNGLETPNLISQESFNQGRSIYTFNFVSEDMKGTVPVEMSAHMRITINFGDGGQADPYVLLLIGDSVGILSVDNARHIHCDVRA